MDVAVTVLTGSGRDGTTAAEHAGQRVLPSGSMRLHCVQARSCRKQRRQLELPSGTSTLQLGQ
ncbi:MAG TPA: hypothetical protein DCX12_02765 [Chloroflexi bacterium]|jgi:hypothetical protein|nr:hypothetical protein [Chloroflexota bacterium]